MTHVCVMLMLCSACPAARRCLDDVSDSGRGGQQQPHKAGNRQHSSAPGSGGRRPVSGQAPSGSAGTGSSAPFLFWVTFRLLAELDIVCGFDRRCRPPPGSTVCAMYLGHHTVQLIGVVSLVLPVVSAAAVRCHKACRTSGKCRTLQVTGQSMP